MGRFSGSIIFLLLLGLILVGCGVSSAAVEEIDEPFVGPPPPINPTIAAQQENITLEVWLDLNFTQDDSLMYEIAKDFEKAYPQVKVNIQSFVDNSIPQRVSQAIQFGSPPDVVQGHVYAVAGQGLAKGLDQQWQVWGPEARDQFLPSAMEEVTWNGKLYGVPLDIYTLVLLYNQDHFDEANLSYPGGNYDINGFREAARLLTRPEENRYGLGFSADPWYAYAWLAGAGGDVIASTSDTDFVVTLDSKNNIDALRFLTSIVEAGYGQPPTTRPHDYEDMRKQFLKGQISMYFGGPWDIHYIQSTAPDFPLGVAQLPKTPAGESAASVLGSSGLFIPKGAPHPEVAFEFIKWITSDRYAIPMARRLGRYPAKTWLQTSPYFTENLLLIPFFNQLNATRPYRLNVFPAAEDAFADAVKASFYGSDPEDALKEAQNIAAQFSVKAEVP
jgi:ABC-type glycerol-3-phosphate transport system substrate-binding protein